MLDRPEAVGYGAQNEGKRLIESAPPSSRSAKIPRTTPEAEKEKEGSVGDLVSMRQAFPRSQRYLLAVEYAGTRFYGSQIQPNCRTVVGVLEEAFQKFVCQPVSIFCSSRTDAGVHALSNVCHVDVVRVSKRKPGEVLPPHEPGVVRRAVNHFLQKEGDIVIIDVRCVPSDFHSRFNAQERIYFYRIISGPEPLSVFDKERAWHINEQLDINIMQKACNILIGCHDFSSFRASGCQAKSPIRTLDELHVSEVQHSPHFPSHEERLQATSSGGSLVQFDNSSPSLNAVQEDRRNCSVTSGQIFGQRRQRRCYVITARARSFLYHQVRLMVGLLKSVGAGDLTLEDVERILKAKDISACTPMAPACGLYLGNVKYDLP